MARGARLSGSRFAYRIGDVALAEMALYRYVIDKLAGRGFLPVLPPVLAGERAMYGTGFLPTEESNLYHLEQDDLYLTGTSEVALAGPHATSGSKRRSCPPGTPAFTTNFRREAGAAGKDTRGMFRVHQFDKVEMFVYCVPEQSRETHDELLAIRGGDRPGARAALPGDEHRRSATSAPPPRRSTTSRRGSRPSSATGRSPPARTPPIIRRGGSICGSGGTASWSSRTLSTAPARRPGHCFRSWRTSRTRTERSRCPRYCSDSAPRQRSVRRLPGQPALAGPACGAAWRRCSSAPPCGTPRPLQASQPGPDAVGTVVAAGDVTQAGDRRARSRACVQLLLQRGLSEWPRAWASRAVEGRPQRCYRAGAADYRLLTIDQDLVAGCRVRVTRHVGYAAAALARRAGRHPCACLPGGEGERGRSRRRRWHRRRPRHSRLSPAYRAGRHVGLQAGASAGQRMRAGGREVLVFGCPPLAPSLLPLSPAATHTVTPSAAPSATPRRARSLPRLSSLTLGLAPADADRDRSG